MEDAGDRQPAALQRHCGKAPAPARRRSGGARKGLRQRGFLRLDRAQSRRLFDRETFGADKLVLGVGTRPWAELLAEAPLAPAVRAELAPLDEANTDDLPGLSSDEKKARLARISYRDFLLQVAKVDAGVVPVLQAMTHGEWGVGIDAVAALEVWPFKFPGFQGLDLAAGAAPHMGFTRVGLRRYGRL